ncbi:MAG: DUF2142 domain-containing protein [Janthinobacterium lividum]
MKSDPLNNLAFRLDMQRLLALLFCVYATVAVLLLAPLVPPLENPDEINHVHRAEQVASGQWLARRFAGKHSSGGMVDLGVNRVDGPIGIIRFHDDRKVTRTMLNQAGSIAWSSPTGITFANTSIYPPFFYLPAAFGIRIGQVLHQSIARTLIIARIFNGLCCIAITTLAIAASGRAAPLLFSVLCLPMSLSLLASVSQDGLMLAASAMSTAMAYQICNYGKHQRPRLLLLCICLALIAMARPTYLPFLILPLMLPELSRRDRIVAVAGTMTAVLIWIGLTARFTLINANGYRGVDPHAQLQYLFSHVGRLGTIALGTFHRQGATGYSYFHEFIGVLGWSDVTLPAAYYPVAGLVLGVALLLVSRTNRPLLNSVSQGTMAMAAFASILLIFLSEYFSWTKVGEAFVDGVQGRYFLPIALFFPFFLPRILPSNSTRLLVPVAAFPALSIAVMVHSILLRYYL